LDFTNAKRPPESRSLNEPISANGHSYYLPSSRDLARAIAESDPRLAATQLLESCRLKAGAIPPDILPEYGRSMSGYLQRLALSARNPGEAIHPMVGSLYSAPKYESRPPVWEEDVALSSPD
jgi:hypothetical protein